MCNIILHNNRSARVSYHSISQYRTYYFITCVDRKTGHVDKCFVVFFKKQFWRTYVLFVSPLAPLFWTFGDISWVSKPEWAALFTLGRGIHITCSPKFTSGVTPADLLVASVAPEPFSSTYL